jgi:hypothetical protein
VQLEVFFTINLDIIKRARPFRRCDNAFLRSLAMRLKFSQSCAGHNVLSVGQRCTAISFIRRGIMQVLHGQFMLQLLKDGDYFGPAAAASPRTRPPAHFCPCTHPPSAACAHPHIA